MFMKLFILLILIFIFPLNSCKQKKDTKNDVVINMKTEIIKKNFSPILHDYVEQLNKEQSKTDIIIVICYSVRNKECILLINDIGYNPILLKGYINYENSLICYYGIEDSVASKILNLEKINKDIPDEKYTNKKNINDVVFFEPIGEYFIVDNIGKVVPYEPSIEIMNEMINLNIKYGIIPPNPPLPI